MEHDIFPSGFKTTWDKRKWVLGDFAMVLRHNVTPYT